MRVNDIDNQVHLYSIRDNALDVFTYPIMCTLSDLKKFLSAKLECDYNVFPEFFKYPDQYSVFDCGTYEPVLPDSSDNPYCSYSRPRFISRLTDFIGDDDNGKSASTDKDI